MKKSNHSVTKIPNQAKKRAKKEREIKATLKKKDLSTVKMVDHIYDFVISEIDNLEDNLNQLKLGKDEYNEAKEGMDKVQARLDVERAEVEKKEKMRNQLAAKRKEILAESNKELNKEIEETEEYRMGLQKELE